MLPTNERTNQPTPLAACLRAAASGLLLLALEELLAERLALSVEGERRELGRADLARCIRDMRGARCMRVRETRKMRLRCARDVLEMRLRWSSAARTWREVYEIRSGRCMSDACQMRVS